MNCAVDDPCDDEGIDRADDPFELEEGIDTAGDTCELDGGLNCSDLCELDEAFKCTDSSFELDKIVDGALKFANDACEREEEIDCADDNSDDLFSVL